MIIRKSSLILIWNAIAIALLTGACNSLLSSGSLNRSGGNILYQFTTLLFLLPGVIQLFRLEPQKLRRVFHGKTTFFVLLLWALFSVVWAHQPLVSLRRWISLLIGCFYALYLVSFFHPKELHRLFTVASFLILGVTFLSILAGVGFHHGDEHAGALRGFSGHKNNLGQVLGVTTVILYVHFYFQKNFKTALLLFISCGFLILTQSKTSLVVFIIAIMSLYMFLYQQGLGFRYRNNRRTRSAIIFLGILACILMVFVSYTYVLDAIGRDLTFSGRNKIWAYALNVDSISNLWGAGYRNFWIDYHTWDFFIFNPYWGGGKVTGNGHSGYLDIYLEIGVVGAILFGAFIIDYFRKCISKRLTLNNVQHFHLISAAILSFNVVYNIFETSFLSSRLDIAWFTLLTSYFFLSTESNNSWERNNER